MHQTNVFGSSFAMHSLHKRWRNLCGYVRFSSCCCVATG